MKKEIILITFAILLLPTLTFAQKPPEVISLINFSTSMIGGGTYSAKLRIVSYSWSVIPVFFRLEMGTTTPIEANEYTLTASIDGLVLNCTNSTAEYPRNWEDWTCKNNTDYYYFPSGFMFGTSRDLNLNLTLNIAASPQSNVDWKLKVYVQDTQPPIITLFSPQNKSYVKSGVLINLSVVDDIELEQVWYGRQLFYDDFADINASKWTKDLGTWVVIANEYTHDSGVATNTHYFTSAGDLSWTNYTVEAKVNVLNTYGTANAPSILVRYHDMDNFYMCQLRMDENALYIWKRFSGSWTILSSAPNQFNSILNTWHTLRCKVDGNEIFAYVNNGTYAASIKATDTDLTNGKIGLNNYNTYVHFDNVSVESVSLLQSPYDINTTGWPDGLTYINVSATDLAGNKNQTILEFTFDNTPPRVENSTVNKTIQLGENATITVSVWDDVAVDTVIVEDNQTTNYTMKKIDGNYTVTIPHPSLGNHSLRYFANDTVGNINDTVYDWFNVTSDNIKPISIINSPDVGSWHNIDFPVDVTDFNNVALAYCEYRVWSYNGTDWINTRVWTNRTCNSPTSMIITVGYGKDCRDQGNNTCEVHVRAVDTSNNIGDTVMRLFSIDWTAPSIGCLKPKPINNSYTNNTKPEISVCYYDYLSGINMTSIQILVDNGTVNCPPTITSSKVSCIPTDNLPDGIHNVTVKMSDIVGNEAQKTWFFIVDTIPPSIYIISPENKTYDTRKISTEVVTNEEVNYLRKSEDGVHFLPLCRYCNHTKSILTYNEGNNRLTVEAVDYAGNVNRSYVDFFVDSIPPKIIKTLPENCDVVNLPVFYIKYTETNLMNISLYWKESNESTYNTELLTGCPSGVNKECNFTLLLPDSNGGMIDYYFEVQDQLHNVNSSKKTIKIDNKKPLVTIISPEPQVYSKRKIDLNVKVDEPFEKLEYSLDGCKYTRLCNSCGGCNRDNNLCDVISSCDGCNQKNTLCDFLHNCDSCNQKITFKEGNNTLFVRATDYAGNVNQSSVNFFVDSIPPKIIKQNPLDKGYANGTFNVVYTEENLNNITLYYKGVLNSTYNESTNTNCKSGTNKECNFYVNLTDYDGQYIEYKFVVRDNVSETTGKIYTVKVDTTIPNITIHSPDPTPPDKTYYTRSIRLNISVNEPVKLEMSDNGGNFRTLCSKCFSYDKLQTFSYGWHGLIIRAIDNADNKNTATVSFTIKK